MAYMVSVSLNNEALKNAVQNGYCSLTRWRLHVVMNTRARVYGNYVIYSTARKKRPD